MNLDQSARNLTTWKDLGSKLYKVMNNRDTYVISKVAYLKYRVLFQLDFYIN